MFGKPLVDVTVFHTVSMFEILPSINLQKLELLTTTNHNQLSPFNYYLLQILQNLVRVFNLWGSRIFILHTIEIEEEHWGFNLCR